MARRWLLILIPLFLLVGLALPGQSQVRLEAYGITVPADSARMSLLVQLDLDSILRHHPQLSSQQVTFNIARPREMVNRTADFYLLLLLCLLLGMIRFSDPRYFQVLLKSFQNPSGSRPLKDQLQSSSLSNFLMNLFFSVVAGAYVYYIVRLYSPRLSMEITGPLLLLWLILGMMGIYLAKYLVIRFSGWAFRVDTITEQYLFNVFLINKIISIVLLPFVVLIAFTEGPWARPLTGISLLFTALLLLNRYTRSWNVFGSFFQYSKFHFFTYLCASEILPMAILVKLILQSFS